MRKSTLVLLAALCSAPLLVACGGGVDSSVSQDDLENARKHRCRSNGDCHNGQICNNGTCQNPPPQCTNNGGCSNGQVCVSSHCQACTADGQCNQGQVCTNGACGTPTAQCHDNSGCSNGQVCQGGNCQACTADSQCNQGQVCTNGACGTATGGGPTPNPPPAACDQRHAGVTAIQAVVQVTRYQGLVHGRNGTHEIIFGTMINDVWVYDRSIVDTQNVQLALNVKSSIDPTGLPQEIPLAPGQTLEVEGEYIPASSANAQGSAVVHYTHSPCGYAVINGTKYQ